jgi:hypothetical protein
LLFLKSAIYNKISDKIFPLHKSFRNICQGKTKILLFINLLRGAKQTTIALLEVDIPQYSALQTV